MKISKDKTLNKKLKKQVQSVRKSLVEQADKNQLSPQFSVIPHKDRPAMIITNKSSGKSTVVPLFAYSEVRDALNNLC